MKGTRYHLTPYGKKQKLEEERLKREGQFVSSLRKPERRTKKPKTQPHPHNRSKLDVSSVKSYDLRILNPSLPKELRAEIENMPRTKKTKTKKDTKRKRSKSKTPARTKKQRAARAPRARGNMNLGLSKSVSDSLAVYLNPFSNATQNPRIPDGKITESLGVRVQNVREIDALVQDDGAPMEILMFPGAGGGYIVRNLAKGAGLNGAPDGFRVGRYEDHGQVDMTAFDDTGGVIKTADPMNKWRVVSQGLKISLINNAETNDGWWEACRLTPRLDPKKFGFFTDQSDGLEGALFPEQLLADFKEKNIVDQRTYKTGLLRNIHKHIFTLHPTGRDHDFLDFPNEYAVGPLIFGENITGSAALLQGNRMEVDGPTTIEIVENHIDPSMDWVYIRIYPNTAESNRSRMMFHLVGNHEVAYPAEVRDSRYHQRGEIASKEAMSVATTALRNSDSVSRANYMDS